MRFETKARNLVNLFHLSANSLDFFVLPSIIIFKGELRSPIECLSKVNTFVSQNAISSLIFRSSALNEDNVNRSNAGAFLSIANIDSKNAKEILLALEKVANSMDENEFNEILIQPMLMPIEICGVLFSYDKDNLSPYYIAEYDDSGSSSSVTEGSIITKNYIHFRDEKLHNNILHRVINVCKKLESIFNYPYLDIEFAVSKNRIYILQVRPLVIKGRIKEVKHTLLLDLYKKLDAFNGSFPHLHGSRAIFGVMPDWNPAEIIGLRPQKLALTLYKGVDHRFYLGVSKR